MILSEGNSFKGNDALDKAQAGMPEAYPAFFHRRCSVIIRKLEKWEEWFESDRIIGTSFFHGWNEKESEEKFRKQGTGEEP